MSLVGRLWRSRGFGVHSPFAYAMITETLCPGRRYTWYGYADARSRRERLLVRLRGAFAPECRMLVAPEATREQIEAHDVTVLLGRHRAPGWMERGMVFQGPRETVIVNDPRLPAACYKLWF